MNAQRLSLVLVLLASLVVLSGCGDRAVVLGEIEIYNSAFSFEFIDSVEILEEFGPHSIFFSPFLAPDDSAFSGGHLPGRYTVRLFWSDGSQDTFFGVRVFEGSTTTVTGEN